MLFGCSEDYEAIDGVPEFIVFKLVEIRLSFRDWKFQSLNCRDVMVVVEVVRLILKRNSG